MPGNGNIAFENGGMERNKTDLVKHVGQSAECSHYTITHHSERWDLGEDRRIMFEIEYSGRYLHAFWKVNSDNESRREFESGIFNDPLSNCQYIFSDHHLSDSVDHNLRYLACWVVPVRPVFREEYEIE